MQLPENKDIYSHLNMEDITDADYAYAKRVCKDFEIKNLGEYHDLHVQNGTLLLPDVFENFRNMYPKIYELDPEKFISSPVLVCFKKVLAALKKTKVKLDLLTDIGILVIVEVDVKYTKRLYEIHNDLLPFLLERIKIKTVGNLVPSRHAVFREYSLSVPSALQCLGHLGNI